MSMKLVQVMKRNRSRRSKLEKQITDRRNEYKTTIQNRIDEKHILRRFNYGNYDYENSKDLNDHRRRPLYKSEIQARILYGSEWKEISTKLRTELDYTCEECNRRTYKEHFHIHHLIAILTWIRNNPILKRVTISVLGVETDKPYHIRSNLRGLCANCHADEHNHMTRPGEHIYC